MWEVLDNPSGKVMEFPGRFVESADPDTIPTINSVFGPKPIAFLHIHIPFERPSCIGDACGFCGPGPTGNGLPRTVFGTFQTCLAELGHTEFHGFIAHQGEISKDLAQSDPRAKFGGN